MAFEIIHNGKVLTDEEFESVKDIVMSNMNGKLSKYAFELEMTRRLSKSKPVVTSISVGDKKGLGVYKLFVNQNGATTVIDIPKSKFEELIHFGCSVSI